MRVNESPVLCLQSLTKSYGQQVVLQEIDLAVSPGEFLTFLGPSGSGKSTLLRLVGGFERVDRGRILLENADISQLPPYKRRVNTVFQNYALFPHLTVLENITFGLRNLGLARPEVERRANDCLEMVQLNGFESRMPDQLSGGQQQRVALARALVMQPAVLLLDEPLGALDQKLRLQMQAELKSLQRKLGLTFVFVTHDQEEALSLSDRIAVLSQGRLEQVGTPYEIYERPATCFVADFMGVKNIFALASIETNGNLFRCQTRSGQVIHVSKANCAHGNFRYFAIRPAKVLLLKEPPSHPFGAALKGRIHGGAYLGSSQQWLVRVGDEEIWYVSQPETQHFSEVPCFSAGDEVYLYWSEGSGTLLE